LEAVCTKCNPKLIPVFKAKNDWCAEHDFPESFCPICHPEMHGRPAMDVAVDEAPADGLRIKFATKEVAKQIGLETTEAVSSDEARVVTATATIVADASKTALVNARASGIIRSFKADLGTKVARGSALAVIESPNVAANRADLLSAQARVESRQAAYEREKNLQEKGISAMKDVEAAKQELEEAKAELAAAQAAVGLVGQGEGAAGTYTLTSPIQGTVTGRHFTVGTLVDPEETIFEVMDTSSLWAEIDIPEAHAGEISVGQNVTIEVDGTPPLTYEAKIQYVAPQVDPHTRTVRAAVPNKDGRLRANTYARARFSHSYPKGAVLVPRAAVQDAKGVQLAFVPVAVDEYETRRIRAAALNDQVVAVTSGLAAGEFVVTTGSFLLKTETLKGGIGAGCCEVEAPK
jgi:cobalt-zinc-cadmium efflux system membrane fusion protein